MESLFYENAQMCTICNSRKKYFIIMNSGRGRAHYDYNTWICSDCIAHALEMVVELMKDNVRKEVVQSMGISDWIVEKIFADGKLFK